MAPKQSRYSVRRERESGGGWGMTKGSIEKTERVREREREKERGKSERDKRKFSTRKERLGFDLRISNRAHETAIGGRPNAHFRRAPCLYLAKR